MNRVFLGRAVRKDLRRLAADPWKLAVWLGVPLVIGVLMTTVMGGEGGPKPQAKLYVDDRDQSFVSDLLVGAFTAEQLGELVQVERLAEDAAMARLNDGDGSALLVIPEGFGEAVLDESPTTLRLRTNPSQRILPGLIEEVLTLVRDGVFYLHRVFGEELALMRAAPEPGEFTLADPAVARIAVSVNGTMRRFGHYLDPVLIELETTTRDAEGATTTPAEEDKIPASFYMLPSVLLMALFFLAQGQAEDWWAEREHGTLRRIGCAPVKTSTVIAGKLGAVAVTFLALGTLLFAAGYLYHDFLPWQTLPLAVAWWAAGGVALWVPLSWLQMTCGSRRGGAVIGNLLMFPLLMLGGSFFPFEAMPAWMERAGRWTPNGWILQELKPVMLGDQGLLGLLPGFAGLAAGGFVLLLVLRVRLHRAVLRG